MTLRQRLTGSYIFVALAGLLLASVAGAMLVRTMQIRAAERSVRLLSTMVASDIEEPVGDSLPDVSALEHLANTDGLRLFLVEPDGTVHRDSQNTLEDTQLPLDNMLSEAGNPAPTSVRQLRLDGQDYFISVIPVEEVENDRRLLLAIRSASLLDAWYWLLPAVVVLSGLGTLVAWGAGSRIARRITRPVEALKEAAEKISGGDYEVRVEPPEEVAELQMLSKSFNIMADEVRSARQTQRDFLANVSHDLRTPLTSIQGFSQALMDGAVPEEQGARVAGIIYNEATRLSRLVQDLLDLARIEAGRFSMVQRDINLKTVLERCSEKFKPQAESMGVAFETKITRRALPVHGDADRLEQVVTNLIDNALTYAQDGGGHVKLVGLLGGIRSGGGAAAGPVPQTNGHDEEGEKEADAEAKLGRWWIEIRVEDDGPGIADEQKPLVFERFYRADSARRGGGTGLGLAIAREIVEAHGGSIFIEDAETKGTQFVVRLPMKMK